jgi:hypothetical protein
MALAFALGIIAGGTFVLSGNVAAYAASAAAGLLTAWLVTDRARGLGGVVAGVAAVFAVWGAKAVMDKIESCSVGICSGITGPEFTAWIVFALGMTAVVLALAGYVVGRIARRILGRRSMGHATGA